MSRKRIVFLFGFYCFWSKAQASWSWCLSQAQPPCGEWEWGLQGGDSGCACSSNLRGKFPSHPVALHTHAARTVAEEQELVFELWVLLSWIPPTFQRRERHWGNVHSRKEEQRAPGVATEYWIIPNILISVKPELVEQDSNPDCVAPGSMLLTAMLYSPWEEQDETRWRKHQRQSRAVTEVVHKSGYEPSWPKLERKPDKSHRLMK